MSIIGDKIYVYSKSWDSKKKQITSGSRIKDYVNQKFKKLGDNLGGVLAYVVATQCQGGYDTIKAASKISPEAVASKLKATLK